MQSENSPRDALSGAPGAELLRRLSERPVQRALMQDPEQCLPVGRAGPVERRQHSAREDLTG